MSLKQDGQLSENEEKASCNALQLRSYAIIVRSFVDVWTQRDERQLPLSDALMLNYQVNQYLAAAETFMLSIASLVSVLPVIYSDA